MSNFERRIPPGDSRERLVCRTCDFINYENPKIVAGVVVEDERGLLLCRRAIEPRAGFWTLPGGFIENHESPAEGAVREAWEEACAKVETLSLLTLYTVRHISQVHLFFRAKLLEPSVAVGEESLEVRFFSRAEIPWEQLAFRTVRRAILAHLEKEDDCGTPDVFTFE